MRYILNKPNISSVEKKYILDVLKTGWISSNGKHNVIAEKKFSKLVNKKYSITVQSGTAALHVALKAINVKMTSIIGVIDSFVLFSVFSTGALIMSFPVTNFVFPFESAINFPFIVKLLVSMLTG